MVHMKIIRFLDGEGCPQRADWFGTAGLPQAGEMPEDPQKTMGRVKLTVVPGVS
jgi:hypothetical protein